ncbi:AAA domain-containing protein [Aphelenchoides fujianensis]|nr:AAA domain-containing protein [Aphelenchoides fujianensis]
MLKLPVIIRQVNGGPTRRSFSVLVDALRRTKPTAADCWRSVLFTSKCLNVRPIEVMRMLNVRESIFQLATRLRSRRGVRSPNQRPNANPKSSAAGGDQQSSEEGGDNKPPIDPQDFKDRLKRLFAIALFVYGLIYLWRGPEQESPTSVVTTTWSDFTNKILPTGQIAKIVVFPEKDHVFIYTYGGSRARDGSLLAPVYRMGIPSVARFESEVRAAEAAIQLPPEHWTQIEYKRYEGVVNFVQLMLIFGVIAAAYFVFKNFKVSFKMSDMMSPFTKARFQIWDPHAKDGKLRTKFKDVAGLHEAKVEMNEFVDYLRNPNKYTRLGARLPKGALLTGPPGCGKTFLAKALAAESSSPFLSMNGTEFVEMIGGLGASRMRDLFKEAKSRAPCIIYIDEIDAIGRKRSQSENQLGGGTGEEEQTLNQLLVEMDGMDTNQGVVVIASTNRPDILDKALTRRGRFDRHISVDLPTVLERQELFEMYLKKIKLQNKSFHGGVVSHVDKPLVQRLSQMTPGFSGADIANVVNEAAIHAATKQKKFVSNADIDYAMEKVIAGPEKRSRVLAKEEREVVAYHESGHALVGWLLEHTDALLKVTIVPRTSAALGFAQYTPQDKKLFSKEELFEKMQMMLGGRAAENIVFGRITTGAQNDLERVTKQAYAQVKKYGMCDAVGLISFPSNPGDERRDEFAKKPYSKKLGRLMDEEARKIVARAYFHTEKLLQENREMLEKLAKALLERESLSYEQVKELIGPPKFGEKKVVEVVDQSLPNVDDKE